MSRRGRPDWRKEMAQSLVDTPQVKQLLDKAAGLDNQAGDDRVKKIVRRLGVEHFLDLYMDEKERRAGLEGGTPRTIEGPLYLADAPLSKGEARLDQDPEEGTVLVMEGQVRDTDGKPLPGAIVDVWHANTK